MGKGIIDIDEILKEKLEPTLANSGNRIYYENSVLDKEIKKVFKEIIDDVISRCEDLDVNGELEFETIKEQIK